MFDICIKLTLSNPLIYLLARVSMRELYEPAKPAVLLTLEHLPTENPSLKLKNRKFSFKTRSKTSRSAYSSSSTSPRSRENLTYCGLWGAVPQHRIFSSFNLNCLANFLPFCIETTASYFRKRKAKYLHVFILKSLIQTLHLKIR